MAPQLLVIDNYDSFVYNLVQYFGELGVDPVVVRNDAMSIDEIRELAPRAIVVSPGPGRPADAGVSNTIIRELGPTTPVLGVCLGHQCIGEVFGGSIVRAGEIMHGKVSAVHHRGVGIVGGLPNPFEATRYHSLVIDPATVPDELEITAETVDGTIMGVRHREFPIEGVQFHPESILTAGGHDMLRAFLRSAGIDAAPAPQPAS
jgi:anthranilate synthase component II